ncbi:hypothetical protein [Plantibacter sp. ME-Dv--P-122b]|uniref:hypothetical protein n=1 Tax=Plantibacter sp. ME-Dv--P-122b TaxID=3040300 RepID=UPI00254A8C40|nr:hypothetical protein [Plantibacter sp. ME-Dv--P-122b]
MGRIDWRHINENDFNDIVEALLVREYTRDGLRAHALGGRGGDDGIDVAVRVEKTNQLVHTLQLKYFPGGFSGGNGGRRAQIKHSLARAIDKETPPLWTLVVPTNPTARERKAVLGMRNGARVTIRFMGPAELDGLLAKHPDIEDRFTIDRSIQMLAAVHRPEAALAKPGDLRAEVSRLQERLEGRSEYWAPSVTFASGGSYIETLQALREDSHEREPLGISLSLGFNADDADLKKQFEDSMKFGVIDAIHLPERVVLSLDKVGPEWFAEEGSRGSLVIGPAEDDHEPVRARVEVRDPNERAAASLSGQTRARARGVGGGTIRVSLEGGVTQTWRFPVDINDTGAVSTEAEFAGNSAREIRRALRFLDALASHTEIGITLAGETTLWMNFRSQASPLPDRGLWDFVEDLCTLEDHFDVTLRYPSNDVPASDRLWARILVMLIRGEAVAHPNTGTFGGTLNGMLDEGLELLLVKGAAAVASDPDFVVEVLDTPFHLDEVAYYTHHAVADGSERLLADLRAGKGEGNHLAIRPADELPWVIYSPSHLEAAGHSVVITKPWSVEGINEHPGYTRLPNKLSELPTGRG